MRTAPSRGVIAALVVVAAACAVEDRRPSSAESATTRAAASQVIDPAFAEVPDSIWIDLTGPTLIAFHPIATNEQLAADEGLATQLDDLAYHIGTALDSLTPAGVTVHYVGGDTVWTRIGSARSRFVRAADSARVGYLFADERDRRAVVYGVLFHREITALMREFRASGRVERPPRE